jgi:hypothetical protein
MFNLVRVDGNQSMIIGLFLLHEDAISLMCVLSMKYPKSRYATCGGNQLPGAIWKPC